MRRVVVLAEAAEDLAEARRFYDAKEPGVGDYCLTSLLSDIESLALYHGIHQRHWNCFRMLASRFPFGIYYVEAEQETRVVAVLEPAPEPELDSAAGNTEAVTVKALYLLQMIRSICLPGLCCDKFLPNVAGSEPLVFAPLGSASLFAWPVSTSRKWKGRSEQPFPPPWHVCGMKNEEWLQATLRLPHPP